MRIDEIDKNLKVEKALGLEDVVFIDVRRDPFSVYGLYDYKNQPVFRRLPEDVAKATNPGYNKNIEKSNNGTTEPPPCPPWDHATIDPLRIFKP